MDVALDQSGARSLTAAAFGKRLRSWRKWQGIPQKTVANAVGVSISVVSEWERARRFPTAGNLDKIIALTGLPICSLFYGHASVDGDDNCSFKLCPTCRKTVRLGS